MDKYIETYAAYTNDNMLLANSSSGGVFSVLAEYAFWKHGVVYGVAMSENCRKAEMVRISNRLEMNKLRGSKYIQAEIGDAFQRVYQDLEEGKFVLFSGTGCQINGLKLFLGKTYSNLCCVAVICHGVPPMSLWNMYADHIEKIHKMKLRAVNFRDKSHGWSEFAITTTDEGNKRVCIPAGHDAYMQMFLRNYCLRPSCYKCLAKAHKSEDITIGDFWGIENVLPDLKVEDGISAVIVRTQLGQKVFNACKTSLQHEKVKYDSIIAGNSAEYVSVEKPNERTCFFEDMRTKSFFDLSEKYIPRSRKRKLKDMLLKTPLRKFFRGGV